MALRTSPAGATARRTQGRGKAVRPLSGPLSRRTRVIGEESTGSFVTRHAANNFWAAGRTWENAYFRPNERMPDVLSACEARAGTDSEGTGLDGTLDKPARRGRTRLSALTAVPVPRADSAQAHLPMARPASRRDHQPAHTTGSRPAPAQDPQLPQFPIAQSYTVPLQRRGAPAPRHPAPGGSRAWRAAAPGRLACRPSLPAQQVFDGGFQDGPGDASRRSCQHAPACPWVLPSLACRVVQAVHAVPLCRFECVGPKRPGTPTQRVRRGVRRGVRPASRA